MLVVNKLIESPLFCARHDDYKENCSQETMEGGGGGGDDGNGVRPTREKTGAPSSDEL